jgi:DNA-binding NtrC family response regulator
LRIPAYVATTSRPGEGLSNNNMAKIRHCLLIDDDIDDQEIFKLALTQLDDDIDCLVANNAIEALEWFRADSSFVPSHIFIDVNMPRMNGIECLREIKKLSHLDSSEVFIYSTTSDPKIVKLTADLGARFIVKPSSLESLVSILAESFKSKNSR